MENIIRTITEYFNSMLKVFSEITIKDIADIILVSIVLYMAIKFIRDKRAERLIVGIFVLVVVKVICDFFELTAMNYILRLIFQNGLVFIAIIFQPELRSLLELVAEPLKSLKFGIGDQNGVKEAEGIVKGIRDACCEMSKQKTGALIVIERDTKLGEIIDGGVRLNALISSELIKNIFFKNSPLHDGAMIIRHGRIEAAGCILPNASSDAVISRDLGTRHRAAFGVSEVSDAVVIVVSEETGVISIVGGGSIKRGYDYTSLYSYLTEILVKPLKKDKNATKKKDGENNDDKTNKKDKKSLRKTAGEEESDDE